MKKKLTRRDFLKLGGMTVAGLAFDNPFPPGRYQFGSVPLGRVTFQSISVFAEPNVDALTVGYRFRDSLLNLYERIASADGPAYNPVWYRVWGGYVHSAYIQPVEVQLNAPLESVPQYGRLAEVSVPFSQPYNYTSQGGWEVNPDFYLYNKSTHWITDLVEGPDGEPWYQITSELYRYFQYYLPAAHMRPFEFSELEPISTDVPANEKRIVVSLLHQSLTAYEGDKEVMNVNISSGVNRDVPEGTLPTRTPTGYYRIESKMPSKHMGENRLTDNLGDVSLPGVPWSMFFAIGGYALHGAYWHSNFGAQMSHGCVNMSMADSLWLFRWTTPVFRPEEVQDESGWEARGQGTSVQVTGE